MNTVIIKKNSGKTTKTTETIGQRMNNQLVKAMKASVNMMGNVLYLDDSLSDKKRRALVNAIMSQPPVYAPFGNVNVEVPTGVLALDMSYQRDPRKEVKQILKLVTNFSSEKFMPIVVSYRDGVLYVLDGGHRLMAAIILGIKAVPVIILTGKTQIDEANYFKKQNDERVTIKPYDQFKAGLVCRDATALSVDRACNDFNLTVTANCTGVKRPMKAIKTAFDVVDANGESCLHWMFEVMDAAGWFDCRKILVYEALVNHVMNGFAGVYDSAMQSNALDKVTNNLVSVCKRLTPKTLDAFGQLYNWPQPMSMDKRSVITRVLNMVANGEVTVETILEKYKSAGNNTPNQVS